MTTVSACTIATLFPPAALDAAVADGYVRRQVHPEHPFAILNYTEKAQFEGVWDVVTLNCRGLVYNVDTSEIVARPFRKFFNHGQIAGQRLDLAAEVIVTDKADGSLGILYPTPGGGHALATRGSFTSEQAAHATDLWQRRYAHRFTPLPGVTYLFEIIYPTNRIVLDYQGLDDLVLLGAVNIASGHDAVEAAAAWPGPRVEQFGYLTLADALAAPARANAEGLVVFFPATGDRVKLKQEDYVALHRIVTGLNARTVWQHLMDGKPLEALVEGLPDEFHDWIRRVDEDLRTLVEAEDQRLATVYRSTVEALPTGWTRKDFALAVSASPDRWALFHLLDNRPIRDELLKRAKPDAFQTPSGRTYGEDTA